MEIQRRCSKEGIRGRVRDARLRRNDLSLSYASINWIRFEGSSCRAVRSMTSQPPVGAPLAVCKVTLWSGDVNRGRASGLIQLGHPSKSPNSRLPVVLARMLARTPTIYGDAR
jgi:hypothetical protein